MQTPTLEYSSLFPSTSSAYTGQMITPLRQLRYSDLGFNRLNGSIGEAILVQEVCEFMVKLRKYSYNLMQMVREQRNCPPKNEIN